MAAGYDLGEASLTLGSPMLGTEIASDVRVKLPLSMVSRVKDVAVDFAKDMLTTADGRRTLRTVFGTLFGKK